MCESCESAARVVIDAANRIRAGHLAWSGDIMAAPGGDTDRLAQPAMVGSLLVASMDGSLFRAYLAAPLSDRLDPELCVVGVLDQLAVQARSIRHVDVPGG